MDLLLNLIKTWLSLEGAEKISISSDSVIRAQFPSHVIVYHLGNFTAQISVQTGRRLYHSGNLVFDTNSFPGWAGDLEYVKSVDDQGEEYWETRMVKNG